MIDCLAGGKGLLSPCGMRTLIKQKTRFRGNLLAGGKGFEPLQANPESAVLPLDEPPERETFYHPLIGLSRILSNLTRKRS